MSFQKFTTKSYCVDRGYRSFRVNTHCDVTSESGKILTGHCSISKRKKFLTGSDSAKTTEGLGDFFKSLCTKRLIASKKMAEIV